MLLMHCLVAVRTEAIDCDLSQPAGLVREMLCWRYGVRNPDLTSLVFDGKNGCCVLHLMYAA